MFYEPVLGDRYFTRRRRYSQIDWTQLDAVIEAFRERIDDWYLAPMKYFRRRMKRGLLMKLVAKLLRWENPGHFAFAAMAMNCLLIDALSQYAYGKLSSRGDWFRDYLTNYLPHYAPPLATHIWHYDHGHHSSGLELLNMRGVIWNGFRCGILHRAHAPLYCSVDPGGTRVKEQPGGKTKYAPTFGPTSSPTSTDCPSVTINPWLLFDDLERVFRSYISNLKDRDSKYDTLRINFKIKFTDSFGIDIMPLT